MKYLLIAALVSILSGCSDSIIYTSKASDIERAKKMIEVVSLCESVGMVGIVSIEVRSRMNPETGYFEDRPYYKVTCEEKTQ